MHDRRGLVVIGWVVAFVLIGGISGAVGPNYASKFEAPGESAKGFKILADHFGGAGGGITGTIVYRAEQGIDNPEVKKAIEEHLAKVAAVKTSDTATLQVVSPFSLQGQQQIARTGPEAGKVAYAEIEAAADTAQESTSKLGQDLYDSRPTLPGLQTEIGGQSFAAFGAPESETLGIGFAIVILLLAFGSVLAMGLPIGTALAGIGVGASIGVLASQVIEMPSFSPVIGVMIGLGVGIDYALFIVSRYREEIHHGRSSSDACAIAIDTAGRAVLFAGITVVISLMGMLVMGLAFVRGLAIAASIVVAVTMFASLTLLPALLGFATHRVEVTRWRGLIAAGLVAVGLIALGLKVPPVFLACVAVAVVVVVAGLFVPQLKREVPRPAPRPVEHTLAYRWSRLVQRYPIPMVAIGLVVLLSLAIPVLGLRLGFSDEGNYSKETTTRRAYDLLAQGFGPGFNGPLLVAAEVPASAFPAVPAKITQALQGDPGVAAVIGPIPNNPTAPNAVLWRVIPKAAPQDEATTQTVQRLRGDVLPAATTGTAVKAYVTGFTTVSIDFSDFMAGRMPLFFAAVLLLSFLLLMVVFQSVLVPLKAVLMNLLSIGAAYGICVMVFQWGWGLSVLGLSKAPIEPFMPMMLFAIVFGLSMDYEVFLLSRVKEEYDRTGDNAGAVADGLASTARLITAAAAIMVFVFGSFLLESDRVVKLFGLGLSTAILLDATVVRMLLVPATMELLGDRNWWMPTWLGKVLPKVDVDGMHHETPVLEGEPVAV
jgi:RND superfamily putative drug exporter